MEGSNEALMIFHRRELETLESMTGHKELAAACAIFYCAEEGISPPFWAVERSAALLCSLLRKDQLGKSGRAAGLVARYRQDLIDLERWDAVEEARWNQGRWQREIKLINEYPN